VTSSEASDVPTLLRFAGGAFSVGRSPPSSSSPDWTISPFGPIESVMLPLPPSTATEPTEVDVGVAVVGEPVVVDELLDVVAAGSAGASGAAGTTGAAGADVDVPETVTPLDDAPAG